MKEFKKFNGTDWQTIQPKKYDLKEISGTPPFSFESDGRVLQDWGMMGQAVQISTPTPENPIMPSGCGERTGNLVDIKVFQDGMHLDITTGLPTPFGGNRIATMQPIDVSQYNNITVTYDVISQSTYFMYSIFNGDTLIKRVANKTSGATIDTSNATKMYLSLYPCVVSDVNYIMGNTGSTALPYEPYGYKLPILSNSTLTNIYLGEVETTRRIKKLVLTGEEGWVRTGNTNCYYINSTKGCPIDYLKSNTITVICSHYAGQKNTSSGSNEVNKDNVCFFTGGGYELYIGEINITSVTDFKSFLAAQYAAGTPVTVWYVLAEPENGIVNEPLMKIDDYADEISKTGTSMDIPTASGSNTLTVSTAVQPSEMIIESISQWIKQN